MITFIINWFVQHVLWAKILWQSTSHSVASKEEKLFEYSRCTARLAENHRDAAASSPQADQVDTSRASRYRWWEATQQAAAAAADPSPANWRMLLLTCRRLCSTEYATHTQYLTYIQYFCISELLQNMSLVWVTHNFTAESYCIKFALNFSEIYEQTLQSFWKDINIYTVLMVDVGCIRKGILPVKNLHSGNLPKYIGRFLSTLEIQLNLTNTRVNRIWLCSKTAK